MRFDTVAFLAALATLTFPAMAFADQPQPERVEQRCQRANADTQDPDLRRAYMSRCLTASMAFDPGLYFSDAADESPDRPGGIVDASFESGTRGPRWSFAINPECTDAAASYCPPGKLRVVLRAVTWKTSMPPGWQAPPHDDPGGAKRFLDQAADWREADLRSCPGATKLLLSLEHLQWLAFQDVDKRNITGAGEPKYLVVVNDGDGVVVRARGLNSVVTANDMAAPGGPGAWAVRMMRVATPCLKPIKDPAPWDR